MDNRSLDLDREVVITGCCARFPRYDAVVVVGMPLSAFKV